MRYFLCLLALFFAMTDAAYAQERVIPESRPAITLSYAPLVKKVAPAVVNIYSKMVVTQNISPFMGDPFFQQFFGGNFGGVPRQRVESALGSGVIVDSSGLIVTNAHVVKNAQEVRVALNDGQEFAAQKILVDAPSDLALLRINPGTQKLPTATLAPSEKLEVGDLVLAIGNPFGVGQTVTSGIVSALGRSSLALNDYNFFIQTDAAINPGNSGGPLVAMDGGVVGINSAIFSRSGGSVGIGFAIPSELVASLIAAEKSGQKGDRGVTRAWIGVGGQAVTHDLADSLGLKNANGVLVNSLNPASPAKAAGLAVGDVVTAISNHPVHDPAELKFRMAMVPLGAPAQFTINHKGTERTIQVIAAAAPNQPPRDDTTLTGNHPLNGVRVANINPAVASELDLKQDAGVVVINTDQATLGVVARGDVIVSLNRQLITTVAQLRQLLNTVAAQGWDLVTLHNGERREITVR